MTDDTRTDILFWLGIIMAIIGTTLTVWKSLSH